MISQKNKKIERLPWPQLNPTFGIAKHQKLSLKPFFGGSGGQYSQTQAMPVKIGSSP